MGEPTAVAERITSCQSLSIRGRFNRHHHQGSHHLEAPDLDTGYHCEKLGPVTLGQMLDGVDPDLIPSDQAMCEDLLWAFGAWDTLERTNASVLAPDSTVGLCLVGSNDAGKHEAYEFSGGDLRAVSCCPGSGNPQQ